MDFRFLSWRRLAVIGILVLNIVIAASPAGAVPFEECYFTDEPGRLGSYNSVLEKMELDIICKSADADVYGVNRLLQSFVPRRSTLAAVAVGLLFPDNAAGEAVLRILPERDLKISEEALGESWANWPTAESRSARCWTVFIFNKPLELVPGQRYWLEINPGGVGCGYIEARDIYPDGFLPYRPATVELGRLADDGCDINFATIVPVAEKDDSLPPGGQRGLIADRNLERVIRKSLDKLEGSLTIQDLSTLTEIVAKKRGIRNLSGIEHCVNLRVLDLFNNDLDSIDSLGSLPRLEKLVFGSLNMHLPDMAPLGKLGTLRELSIFILTVDTLKDLGNLDNLKILALEEITFDGDISFLAGLTSLEKLTITSNLHLEDADVVAGLHNLGKLSMNGLNLSRIPPLDDLPHLSALTLVNNRIRDLSPLAGRTNLLHLNLASNRVIDLTPLSGLTSLELLCLAENFITDAGPLSGLTSLKTLMLYTNSIEDLSFLSKMRRLRIVSLDNNCISSLAPLLEATGIGAKDEVSLINNYLDSDDLDDIEKLNKRKIHVCHNPIRPITFADPNLDKAVRQALGKPSGEITYADACSLTYLDASRRGITKLNGLEACRWLWNVDLSENSLTSASKLAAIKGLSIINLAGNSIENIYHLAQLDNLTCLDLRDNRLRRINALLRFENLDAGDVIYLGGNPAIRKASSLSLFAIEQLRKRGVQVILDR